jgi:transposase
LEARFKRELSDPKLSETKRKILESLERHWEGLMLFVELPFVPMDNNRAERQLRPQAVARKNYYGSGSVWNARLSSAVWSVFATCELHGVNPQEYLLYWLKQCASNGGKPPEKLEGFLPWDYPQNIRAGPAQEKKAA